MKVNFTNAAGSVSVKTANTTLFHIFGLLRGVNVILEHAQITTQPCLLLALPFALSSFELVESYKFHMFGVVLFFCFFTLRTSPILVLCGLFDPI